MFDGGRFDSVDESLPKTGLFGVKGLEDPVVGFGAVCKAAVRRSRDLIEEIRLSPPERKVVDRMDELSDDLCAVVDLAEFIRHVHPDQAVTAAAEETCLFIQNYFQE